MAFPTTSVIETFTGADTTTPPNSNWTNFWGSSAGANLGIRITSNRAAANNTSFYCTAYWDTETFGPNCEAFCTITTVPINGDIIGLWIRGQSPGLSTDDGYLVGADKSAGTDTFDVYRIDNNTYTLLGSAISQEFAANDSFGISAVGSTLEIWYKASGGSWTSLGTKTDGTYSGAGYIGISIDKAAQLDDFGGGTVVAASTIRQLASAGVGK